MAEIIPFRAWRYADKFSIDELTSPLFDVVSEKQLKALYQTPYNSIHLSVPAYGVSYSQIAELQEQWKKEGILVQDKMPAIYVYYQYFSLQGSKQQYCRKGFIAMIKAYDWNENQVLRHENVLPHSVNDRTELLRHTQMNIAPTHGLYTDPHHELEAYMDESMLAPIYETEDYQGVRDVFALIQDARIIKKFQEVLAKSKVILADGHHRYTGSLEYRKERRKQNTGHTDYEPYNYHLMYLTNTESDDLRILPTHRLIKDIENFSEEELLKALVPYFEMKAVLDAETLPDIIAGKKWTFGLLTKKFAYKIRLKEEAFSLMTWNFPKVVKELDLTVLHYFVIQKALKISKEEQLQGSHITFVRNFHECLEKVEKEEVQVALITQGVEIDQVKRVCESGYTMPQKSTYFYPKVICGFAFASIKEKENDGILDKFFKNL
ncbi:MAG: DUF1015 domain-containing protein [Thermonemataceae bacterium]|nr:DUF1015 domain-containing protein [Thermonemataceae bacterium]